MNRDNDVVEFSLFGPGIGESILVKFQSEKWIIVDSCINPETNQPAALEYLLSLGVDVENDIELIVISHWHDDHIRGITKIIETCPNATIAFSAALLKEEFLQLVFALADESTIVDKQTSGLKEISKVIANINRYHETSNNWKLKLVTDDNRIYFNNDDEVWSLSPSPASIAQSLLSFKELLDNQKNNRKIVVKPKQNDCSVALHVATNKGNILLGSDLEDSKDKNCGWKAVVNSKTRPQGKCKIYKVAHHGSITGHYDATWTNMLENDAYSAITTFNRKHLPLKEDIARIKKFTSNIFCTTTPLIKPKKMDKTTKKLTDGVILEREVLKKSLGHIKIILEDPNSISVDMNESAVKY